MKWKISSGFCPNSVFLVIIIFIFAVLHSLVLGEDYIALTIFDKLTFPDGHTTNI